MDKASWPCGLMGHYRPLLHTYLGMAGLNPRSWDLKHRLSSPQDPGESTLSKAMWVLGEHPMRAPYSPPVYTRNNTRQRVMLIELKGHLSLHKSPEVSSGGSSDARSPVLQTRRPGLAEQSQGGHQTGEGKAEEWTRPEDKAALQEAKVTGRKSPEASHSCLWGWVGRTG